jgi:hypothetical protein
MDTSIEDSRAHIARAKRNVRYFERKVDKAHKKLDEAEKNAANEDEIDYLSTMLEKYIDRLNKAQIDHLHAEECMFNATGATYY